MNVFTIFHLELKHLFASYGRRKWTVQKEKTDASELYMSELYIKQEIHKTVIKPPLFIICVSVCGCVQNISLKISHPP